MPRAQLHSCASPGAADGSHDIALNQCLKSIRIRGARGSEAPRSPRIRLMELDVSAPAVSRRAWGIRTQIVRKAPPRCLVGRVVVDDCAGGIRQPDVELVVNTGFPSILGANGKINVRERRVVGPGGATDFSGTGRTNNPPFPPVNFAVRAKDAWGTDRKSTRLNSRHT